jgi:hypothetical protein
VLEISFRTTDGSRSGAIVNTYAIAAANLLAVAMTEFDFMRELSMLRKLGSSCGLTWLRQA